MGSVIILQFYGTGAVLCKMGVEWQSPYLQPNAYYESVSQSGGTLELITREISFEYCVCLDLIPFGEKPGHWCY